jgi:hypothetical protein
MPANSPPKVALYSPDMTNTLTMKVYCGDDQYLNDKKLGQDNDRKGAE